VSAPSINMVGKPSAALAAKIEKDEKERIVQRKEELGEERLKELEQLMQDAKTESEVEPPSEMISSFPITDVSRLVTHELLLTVALQINLGTCRNGGMQRTRQGDQERSRGPAQACREGQCELAIPGPFLARQGQPSLVTIT